MNKSDFFRQQIAILAVASVLICLIRPGPAGIFLVTAMWVYNIFRETRFENQILAMANVAGLLFLTGTMATSILAGSESFSSTEVALIALMTVGVFLGFWAFAMKRIAPIRNRWSHLLVFGICVIVGAVSFRFESRPWLDLFLKLFAALSLRMVWFLTLSTQESRARGQALPIYLSIAPFWNHTPLPFTSEQKKIWPDRLELARSGLLLIVCCAGVHLFLSAFDSWARENLILQGIFSYEKFFGNAIDRADLYLNFYRSDLFSFSDRWIVATAGFTYHLLQLIAISGAMIGIARISGFPVFRYIYKPFASRTFYQALTRANYFYVQVITRTLINPLISELTWIKSPRWRISVSTFLSIFIFGLIYHFIKFPQAIYARGFTEYAVDYLGYSLYFFMISLAAGLSVYRTLVRGAAPEATWKNRLRNLIYFVFYSAILISFGADYFLVPSADHNFFFFKLFDFF